MSFVLIFSIIAFFWGNGSDEESQLSDWIHGVFSVQDNHYCEYKSQFSEKQVPDTHNRYIWLVTWQTFVCVTNLVHCHPHLKSCALSSPLKNPIFFVLFYSFELCAVLFSIQWTDVVFQSQQISNNIFCLHNAIAMECMIWLLTQLDWNGDDRPIWIKRGMLCLPKMRAFFQWSSRSEM